MARIINRLLSAAVAVAYLITGYVGGGPPLLIKWVLYLLLPLACIWFSEELGAYRGSWGAQTINSESPGCFVALLGWVLLLSPVLLPLIQKRFLQ
jgi:hypothetical protein